MMKKKQNTGGNTLKFRTLVFETAFLRKLEGGVLNKYKILSIYGFLGGSNRFL